MTIQSKNPAGGRGFGKKGEIHLVKPKPTSTAPPAQLPIGVFPMCSQCGNLLPRRKGRARCRWTGEHVLPSAHCHGCKGFFPIGGGDAA